jgi:hypothetical protein
VAGVDGRLYRSRKSDCLWHTDRPKRNNKRRPNSPGRELMPGGLGVSLAGPEDWAGHTPLFGKILIFATR